MSPPTQRAVLSTAPSDDRPTVLVVGRGDPMQDALAAALERHAVAVELADTERALDAVFVGAPDLVLLVGDAAEDEGSAVLQRLAANVATAVVPVAILSDDADLDRRLQAFRFGAVAVVERSASVDGMARRVAELARELPERSGEAAGELGEATLDEVVELFSRRLRSGILAVTTAGADGPGARVVLRGDRPVTQAIEEFVERIRPLVSRAEPLMWEFQETPAGKLQQLDLDEPSSSDVDLGALFTDRRIVLVERSPARADDLVQSLRQRGAHVVVIDGEGTNVEKARAIDPDVVVVDVDGVGGWAASTMRTIRRDPRLRWASILIVRAEELWPERAPEPDVLRLAAGLRPLIEPDEAIERRARDAGSAFELRLEITGPARMLRALARTQRTLHLTVRHPRAQIGLDLAEGLVVGATAKLEGGEEAAGTTAIAALLALGSGRVRVEPRTAPTVANVMAPVDAALAGAEHEAPPLRPSLPPASVPPPEPGARGPGPATSERGTRGTRASDPRELVTQLEALLEKLRATLPEAGEGVAGEGVAGEGRAEPAARVEVPRPAMRPPEVAPASPLRPAVPRPGAAPIASAKDAGPRRPSASGAAPLSSVAAAKTAGPARGGALPKVPAPTRVAPAGAGARAAASAASPPAGSAPAAASPPVAASPAAGSPLAAPQPPGAGPPVGTSRPGARPPASSGTTAPGIAAPPASSGTTAPGIAVPPASFPKARKKTIVGLAPPSAPPPAPSPPSPLPPLPPLEEEPTREVERVEISALAAAARAGLDPDASAGPSPPLPVPGRGVESALPLPKHQAGSPVPSEGRRSAPEPTSDADEPPAPPAVSAAPQPPGAPQRPAPQSSAPQSSASRVAEPPTGGLRPGAPPAGALPAAPAEPEAAAALEVPLEIDLDAAPSAPEPAAPVSVTAAPVPASAATGPLPAVASSPAGPREDSATVQIRRPRRRSPVLLGAGALGGGLVLLACGALAAWSAGWLGPPAEPLGQLPVVTDVPPPAAPTLASAPTPPAVAPPQTATSAPAPDSPSDSASAPAPDSPSDSASAPDSDSPSDSASAPDSDSAPASDSDPDSDSAPASDSDSPSTRSPIDLLIARANYRRTHGELQGAEADYLRVLRAQPTNPRALAGIARLYMARRDGRSAVQWAQRLATAAPTQPANHVLLGDALQLAGDRDGARRSWQRALELNPGHREARRRLGR